MWLPRRGVIGEGRIGSLGLAYATYHTWNGKATRFYCTAQGMIFNIL